MIETVGVLRRLAKQLLVSLCLEAMQGAGNRALADFQPELNWAFCGDFYHL